ncbi:hypothetical protein D770_24045 [Flammeovirgaceae bacterium 311]|nr:hypothetical protein D770_24045 [Flammeovirgaceae bacterium 311]
MLANQATATHIRAGEITARGICSQGLTYEITLRGYADTDSEVIFGSNGTLDYGDGTSLVINNDGDKIPRTRLSEDTWVYELKVRHTFPSARTYIVSFREFYRNENVLNMDNSVNMPFYIETVIVIDPFIGVNNTPQLLVPPVDKAAVGKLYLHNPGAYDIDGDSLSYRLVICRQDRNVPVANYRFPHETYPPGDARNGTTLTGELPTLTLDEFTGDLVWNTPGTKGEYNVAFLIEEWRKVQGKYHSLGYVMRDMLIIVGDNNNNTPPVLEFTKEICVVAGEKIEENIWVSDPDGDKVDLMVYGGVFNLGATFSGGTGVNTPGQSVFTWQTECVDVRSQPYQVVIRARDLRGGGVSLTDIKTLNIRVVAPPPVVENLRPIGNRAAEVNFDRNSYSCSHVQRIQVWRREGSIDIPLDTCVSGMPPYHRYQLVDVRKPDEFPFVDNDNWQGLNPGATYCYRFVAEFPQLECDQSPAYEFPQPDGGQSLVSDELCVTLPAKVPLIMNVSVEETSATNGQILVRWMPDPELTAEEVAKPYHYDLYRAEGYRGSAYTRIASNLKDTVFIDQSAELNTKNLVYNYYLMLKDANGVEFDSSSTASTVRVEPIPGEKNITLNWKAQVPWTNSASQYPLHDIYRNRVDSNDPDKLVRIAQVNILKIDFTYIDDGTDAGTGPLQDDVEYCYYIVTSGSYSNPNVPEPLLNSSQQVCSYLKDDIPPCPPLEFELTNLNTCEEFIRETPCGNTSFENVLEWKNNTDGLCRDDLAYWQIYYSPDGTDFEVIGTSTTSRFVHQVQDNPAGYYYLRAMDRSGNLNEPSNVVMRDNCPNYWLPNVITRNGDGMNDVLRPPLSDEIAGRPELYYRCPRFVEAVEFTVYNRWGKEVYSYNSANRAEPDIYIRWDGCASNGERLSNSTYYYVVNVTYRMLDPDKRKQQLKGWVYIVDPERGGKQ